MALIRRVIVKKVDWFWLLTDLQGHGLTMRVITACTGVSKPTLLDIKNQDADPKMHQGELLIALWVRTTGRPADEVPRHGDPRLVVDRSNAAAWVGCAICCPLCAKEHRVRPPKK